MAALTDAQLRAAEARGEKFTEEAPRALRVRYERRSKKIVIDLSNSCSYSFPAGLVQDLQDASDDALTSVEIDGAGFNLHFPNLDVDLYVPALISGIFGTRAWMKHELARVAGQVKSPAKAEAARKNGAKGGRPRKMANG